MSGPPDTESEFIRLAAAWEKHVDDGGASSNPAHYVRHPAFEGIIALGPDAVPFVIERYRAGSLFWGAALARIVGDQGFGDGLTGNLKETRARWLAWWEQRHV